MDESTERLVGAATAVCGEFALREDFSAGGVGAAVQSGSGRIYTGICIDLGCGMGFCAEVAAIAEMLKNRETRIEAVAAVNSRGILPPCGRCRETMIQIDPRNAETRIILDGGRETVLRELLPEHWLSE